MQIPYMGPAAKVRGLSRGKLFAVFALSCAMAAFSFLVFMWYVHRDPVPRFQFTDKAEVWFYISDDERIGLPHDAQQHFISKVRNSTPTHPARRLLAAKLGWFLCEGREFQLMDDGIYYRGDRGACWIWQDERFDRMVNVFRRPESDRNFATAQRMVDAYAGLRLLDDYLEYPLGYLVEHNTLVIYPSFKHDVDRAIVKRDIVGFLSGSDPSIHAHFPDDETGPTACRPRDYWAVVLAKLTGRSLEINVGDSMKERDEKISHLLQEVRDR